MDDGDFEKQVMFVFPGLVATPSFKNMYRQLRVYGFDSVGTSPDGKQQFSHPYFIKGREDLLIHVNSTINKGARSRSKPPPRSPASPGCMMSSPGYHQSLLDLSSGDRNSGGTVYGYPYGLPRLPDPIKLTTGKSDQLCHETM